MKSIDLWQEVKNKMHTAMLTDWTLVIGGHLGFGDWTFRFIVRLLTQYFTKTEQYENATIY